MGRRRAAIAAIVAAMAAAAGLVMLAPGGALDRLTGTAPSETRPCTAPDLPMNETVSRMFAMMSAEPGRVLSCWTPGEVDRALLSKYIAAGAPPMFVLDNEHSRGRDGVLFAAVRVRATWAGSPPAGWENSEVQIVMRQHRDWSWTIDTMQPRNRAAMGDPHCGVCHR